MFMIASVFLFLILLLYALRGYIVKFIVSCEKDRPKQCCSGICVSNGRESYKESFKSAEDEGFKSVCAENEVSGEDVVYDKLRVGTDDACLCFNLDDGNERHERTHIINRINNDEKNHYNKNCLNNNLMLNNDFDLQFKEDMIMDDEDDDEIRSMFPYVREVQDFNAFTKLHEACHAVNDDVKGLKIVSSTQDINPNDLA